MISAGSVGTFCSKITLPASSTTHTDVSFTDTSRPTKCAISSLLPRCSWSCRPRSDIVTEGDAYSSSKREPQPPRYTILGPQLPPSPAPSLTMLSCHPRASVTSGRQPGAQSVGSYLSLCRSFARNFARTTASITDRREKFCPCDNDVTAWQAVHCDTLRPGQRAGPITFRALDLRAGLRNHEPILANHPAVVD